MGDSVKYKAGDVVLLSWGDYEDYGPEALVRVLRDLDIREVMEQFGITPQGYTTSDRGKRFINHLIVSGYALPIEHDELHLGAYDTFASRLSCRHERRTYHLFDRVRPDHPFGTMAEICDICGDRWPHSESAYPATEEDYLAAYPHMRNPETGHRYTNDEYRAAHPELFARSA